VTVFLGLLAFTFLVLTVVSGIWWFLADSNDEYNNPPKDVRRFYFFCSFAGLAFFFWLIY
jgi:hypothetical protein